MKKPNDFPAEQLGGEVPSAWRAVWSVVHPVWTDALRIGCDASGTVASLLGTVQRGVAHVRLSRPAWESVRHVPVPGSVCFMPSLLIAQ